MATAQRAIAAMFTRLWEQSWILKTSLASGGSFPALVLARLENYSNHLGRDSDAAPASLGFDEGGGVSQALSP
ncbi:MAG: hypothetical protein AAFO87_13445 [Cyanobacteria bacterium J06607_6]